MRLHVLCGATSLLRPGLIESTVIEGIVGGHARTATAFWLSPRCGKFYHDFLLDDPADRRIEVFGAALAQDFGARFEPLLLLPELIAAATGKLETGTETEAPRREPLAAVVGVCNILRPEELVLHAVALPRRVDPDEIWAGEAFGSEVAKGLVALREALAAAGIRAGRLIAAPCEVQPGRAGFEPLYRNAVAIGAARRFRSEVEASGLAVDESRAAAAARAQLDRWGQAGLSLERTLDAPRFAALSARLMEAILHG